MRVMTTFATDDDNGDVNGDGHADLTILMTAQVEMMMSRST